MKRALNLLLFCIGFLGRIMYEKKPLDSFLNFCDSLTVFIHSPPCHQRRKYFPAVKDVFLSFCLFLKYLLNEYQMYHKELLNKI